jgi:hypothetical protein
VKVAGRYPSMPKFIHPEIMDSLAAKYLEFRHSHPEMSGPQLKKYSYDFVYADALIETLNLKNKLGIGEFQ